MKYRLIPSLLLSLGSLLISTQASASSFEEAAKHLDLDGTLVGFIDFEGDGKEIGDALNNIYQEVTANNPNIPPIPVDFNQLFTHLGYGSIRSFGFSSKEITPELHRNRSTVLLNGEPKGLMAMYGNETHEFTAAQKAPSDATGAITATMDLTVLRDSIIAILTQVMGPMGEGLAQQQLAITVPQTDLTINEIIEALSGKWDGFWKQSYNENLEQEFKVWLSIDGAGNLLPRIQVLAEGLPIIISEDDSALTADFSQLIGDELPFGLYARAPKQSGELILYTDADWSASSAGPRLTENPEFMALAKRLPKEGIAFSYGVGADIKPLMATLDAFPEGAQYRGAIESAIDFIFGDYMEPTIAMSYRVDNAFVSEQYAGYSTKQLLVAMPAIMVGGVSAAMAIPAYSKVQSSSKEKAVTNNLRQIASAADQYFLENGVTEVNVDKLVGEYIYSLEPIAGESYKGMIINTDMTEISVTLEDGSTVSVPF